MIRNMYQLYYSDIAASIHPDVEWWKSEYNKTHWCSKCNLLRREYYPKSIDVKLNQATLEQTPIGSLSRAPIGVIRNDLRSVLEPWLGRFAFGRCFDSQDELIANYSTFYCHGFVLDRFGPGSRFRQCNHCGQVSTWETVRPRYFLEYSIGEVEVVQDNFCSTFVSERVAAILREQNIKRLKISPVPVYSRPIDGFKLPSDPPDVEGQLPEPF